MPYLLNTPADQEAMLAVLGVSSLEELFAQVPAQHRLRRPLNVPRALCKLELTSHVQGLAGQNASCTDRVCFLGAGSYDHFIPAAVDMLASRGEFYTSYTPYQAEASQGNLQVFFEYQTLITQLTGLAVSNASLYDGASAATEAVLMCLHSTGRYGRVITAASVHPEAREVLATNLANQETEIVTLGTPQGTLDPKALAAALTPDTGCVLVQHPNFFGCLEQVAELVKITHEHGAMFILSVDPISLGTLKRPGEMGVDVVVAEGQALGNPLAFGGPYLGILACQEGLLRKLPGRLVGETVDRAGQRCWVLTLQTREQHIRREKATSNICTNQGLFALRATIYLSLLGPQGLRETSELCLRKAHYAQAQLTSSGKLKSVYSAPFFKEFVVRDPQNDVAGLLAALGQAGFHGGVPLGRWYPDLADCFLVAVTEKRTRSEIDRLVQTVSKLR